MTGLVVCPEPLAAQFGEHILSIGGNAADAAVATAFVEGVTNPLACGIGGFALFQVFDARSGCTNIHGSAVIGSGKLPDDLVRGYSGRAEAIGRHLVEGDINQSGPLSVLVPGFVAAAGSVVSRFGSGRVKWDDLLEGASVLANRGFAVNPYVEKYYTFGGVDRPGYPDARRKLLAVGGASDVYMTGGRYYRTGEWLKQPTYASTLERLRQVGGHDFYSGEIAEAIATTFRRKGLIQASDLREYKVNTTAPITGSYRSYEVLTTPPPSQGREVLEMLRLLEARDLARLGWNTPEYVAVFASAMQRTFQRAAATGAGSLAENRPRPPARHTAESSTPIADGTTHLCVADGEGLIVSVTHSIGSVAGAGFATPGLGFLYNNLLGHFSPLPNRSDSIRGGVRMDGGAPTILLKDGRPVLVIGSSGGSRLVSGIVQTIVNLVDHEMDIQDAVSASRFHSEVPGLIWAESGVIAAIGRTLTNGTTEIRESTYMGCNQAIAIADNGHMFAGTDPRGGQGVGVAP